ncbi:hypothetical protein J1N35_021031 [Gossypium stocksii]|uniref:Uncharacterized protein n=1 Tax=Gossypium stocksii TaxID=47602 RepID=A0A9D3VDU6_9ROSI|nr:hypothetical protein J1N35_021031 [Gossypium stocksii]
MDSTLLDKDMEDNEEGSAEPLLASCSFLNDIFGDPEVVPRVGYQYQAQVPPLVEDWRGLQVLKESLDSKDIVNVPNPIPMGLPIPIFWTKTENTKLKVYILHKVIRKTRKGIRNFILQPDLRWTLIYSFRRSQILS